MLFSDDDFADFQAAPTSAPAAPTQPNLMEMLGSTPMQASRPAVSSPPAGNNNANLFGMLGATPAQPTYTNQNQTSLYGSNSKPMSPPIRATSMTPTSPPIRAGSTPAAAPAAAKPSSNFDDLWSMSLGSSATAKPATGGNKTMRDLTKEKADAGIWGGAQKPAGAPMGSAMGGGGGFGNFGGSFTGGATSSSGGGGNDDLLL